MIILFILIGVGSRQECFRKVAVGKIVKLAGVDPMMDHQFSPEVHAL
jgi:hypothetical protein